MNSYWTMESLGSDQKFSWLIGIHFLWLSMKQSRGWVKIAYNEIVDLDV